MIKQTSLKKTREGGRRNLRIILLISNEISRIFLYSPCRFLKYTFECATLTYFPEQRLHKSVVKKLKKILTCQLSKRRKVSCSYKYNQNLFGSIVCAFINGGGNMLENKYEFENQANRKKNHELVSLNRITK